MNLVKFDYQKALEGAKIYTRSGEQALICGADDDKGTINIVVNGVTLIVYQDGHARTDWEVSPFDIFIDADSIQDTTPSEELHKVICRAINSEMPYKKREYISYNVLPYVEKLERLKDTLENGLIDANERAAAYLERTHSPSSVSDFQAAMNIAVLKAFVAGYEEVVNKLKNA